MVLALVSEMLREAGFLPCPCQDGEEALEKCASYEYPVVLLDLHMPRMSGLETARRIKSAHPRTEVILLTGQPSIETTLAAIDERVFAYLIKPPSTFLLVRTVRSAAERFCLAWENERLVQELKKERNHLQTELEESRKALDRQLDASNQFVGASPAMLQVRRQITHVAPSDMTVLIRGESGTGK
ncbi:response regulator, partial [bacterium]|nr:response regulator [bacterium]